MGRIYVLHPGKIRGFKGEQYFDEHDLAELYGVDLKDCIVYKPGTQYIDGDAKFIHLRPRGDGRYKAG